jgi:hypothetical protein
MLTKVLTTTALATVLATGAFAQATDPATETEIETEAPTGAETLPEQDSDVVTEDPAAETDPADPMTAEDPATATDPADPMMAGDRDGYPLDEGWERVDVAGLSADELIGEDIVHMDDETIATIDDILVTDTGEVESVVARFGGFLGFGADRVLLSMEEIDIIRDADDNVVVRSNLTPEEIEGRPEYEG